MMIRNSILVLFILAGISFNVDAQDEDRITVVQFSGKVITADDDGSPRPLPYTNVAVVGTSRGATADMDGYFSLVALAGEKIRFTRIGFKDVDFVIPDTLTTYHYSYVQIMTQDSFLLPEAVIFPWPDREHFKFEFLAIDITNAMRERAKENLAADVMSEMRYTIPADGNEAVDLQLRQYATEATYAGQIKPQNIFSPLAWKKFIDAWKRGDFKKKKKKLSDE